MTSQSESISIPGSDKSVSVNSSSGASEDLTNPDNSIWARLLYIILFALIFALVAYNVWLNTIVSRYFDWLYVITV